MSKKDKTILITAEINKTSIITSLINELNDEERAKFAINLGENGDCTYELFLLKEISEIIQSMYPTSTLNPEMDSEMIELVNHLKKIDNTLNTLL